MSAERDFAGIVRTWLEEGVTKLPDRVLDDVLDQLPATRQRRARWPAWRFHQMISPSKIAIAAAAIGALAVVSIGVVPRGSDIGAAPAPSPSPTPTPAPIRNGPLPAGTYVATPFSGPGSDLCWSPPQPGCIDAIPDDDIRFTFTLPEGWSGIDDSVGTTGIGMGKPSGAAIIFGRGPWPYDDPCRATAQIPVGPTAADFADALAAHALLDVTTPVDVTLAGYSGKRLDLQVPMDLAGCSVYRPWEPWYYAQGPGERWHLWILDVDGLRVVVQSMDHAETSAQHKAELQAIVDSIAIEQPEAATAFVSGWPERRANLNEPGLYSWDGRAERWMHHGTAELSVWMVGDAAVDVEGLGLEATDFEGPSSEVAARVSDTPLADGRRQLWYLDVGDTRAIVAVRSYPDTHPEDLAEAEAVVGSMRPESVGTGSGRRVVFTLPAGWDSG